MQVISVVLLLAHRAIATSNYALISWGYDDGTSSFILPADVQDAVSGRYAMASIMKGGKVRNWGSSQFTSSFVKPGVLSDVKKIIPSEQAFAVLQEGGTVKSWGNNLQGGDISKTDLVQQSDGTPAAIVTEIYASTHAFVAIKDTGYATYWGISQGQNVKQFQDVRDDLVNIVSLKATRSAFAAVINKTEGKVVTWGNELEGGTAGDNVGKIERDVTEIFSTDAAFAALKKDGSVVVWGEPDQGGEFSAEIEAAVSANVTRIFSNQKAFVALKTSGEVVTWGDASTGGDSTKVRDSLRQGRILDIFTTMHAFAALMEGGKVVTWGSGDHGGDASAVMAKLTGVVKIASSNYAFAALLEGGQVIPWGDSTRGGDASLVGTKLVSDVQEIVGNDEAFVAVKTDGELVVWGSAGSGGQLPLELQPKLQSRIHKVVSHPLGKAFAALICLPIIGNECQPMIMCESNQIWNATKVECQSCKENEVPYDSQSRCGLCEKNGTVPSVNGSVCVDCNPNEVALAGAKRCEQCQANSAPNVPKFGAFCVDCAPGRVASTIGDECVECEAGLVPRQNSKDCEACDAYSYAVPGDTSCTPCSPSWLIKAADDGAGCAINFPIVSPVLCVLVVSGIAAGVFLTLYRQYRRIVKAMEDVDRHDIQKMQAVLQQTTQVRLFRRGQEIKKNLEDQFTIQRSRYTSFDALTQIIDEGDMKLLHASIVIDPNKQGNRMLRQQDLGDKFGVTQAFWTADAFRQRIRMTAVVALSYCWCHPVHPDPRGYHFRILRHAARLRMEMVGKGNVSDLAIFFDFMSIAQHGEQGDPQDPERGVPRTAEEDASFKRGLGAVNIPYACQRVETWILAWVPPGVQNQYTERAWPTFERIVSSLVKDSNNLCCVSDETLMHEDPVVALGLNTLKRLPPLTPKRFDEIIVRKNVTSGKDVDFLKKKYLQTFTDVIGNGKSLWFANLDWGDEEAMVLSEVFSYCEILITVILSGNQFSAAAVKNIVEEAGKCDTLKTMDLADNLVNEDEFEEILKIWTAHSKKPRGLNLVNRRNKYLDQNQDADDNDDNVLEHTALLNWGQDHVILQENVPMFVLDRTVCRPLGYHPPANIIGLR